jgi:hypothetical protein
MKADKNDKDNRPPKVSAPVCVYTGITSRILNFIVKKVRFKR